MELIPRLIVGDAIKELCSIVREIGLLMAIEDQRYTEVVQAIKALVATHRHGFVRTALCGLAIDILRHYGYQVIEEGPPVVAEPAKASWAVTEKTIPVL